MFRINWKKEILTIPNLLSLCRLGLIPVYVSLYLQSKYVLAGGVLAASCLTDAVDGRIARKYNMISTLGKILDPIADKATQFALILCLCAKLPELRWFGVLFFVKELIQGVVGLVFLGRGKMLSGALMAGKVSTTVLFVSMIALVLFQDLPHSVVLGLVILDSVVLLVAFVCYLFAYFGKHPKVEDMEDR